jgi:AcrR family transcriptional regulator
MKIMTRLATKDRLIESAAILFRQKGYNGVSVAEILDAAEAPKGSLYHHFPEGKSDLALAAAAWARDGMLTIIDDAFGAASDYPSGATTFCYKLAKFFDLSGGWDGCPVASILLDGSDNDLFRSAVNTAFQAWSDRIADHALRLGEPQAQARAKAEMLLIGIQGIWVLARAQRSADPIRSLPGRLFPAQP